MESPLSVTVDFDEPIVTKTIHDFNAHFRGQHVMTHCAVRPMLPQDYRERLPQCNYARLVEMYFVYVLGQRPHITEFARELCPDMPADCNNVVLCYDRGDHVLRFTA